MSETSVRPSTATRSITQQIRQRLKNSPRMLPDMSWTLTANIFTVLSGFFVVKIISRWVPTHEYGEASLVLGVLSLLNNLIAGPAVLGYMRVFFEHVKERGAEAYIGAVSRLLLRTAVLMCAVYLAIALGYLTASDHLYWSLALPAVLLVFAQTQLSGTLGLLEVRKRYRDLTIAQSLSKVFQVPFLILLLYLISGRAAVVSSQMLAAAVVVMFWSWIPQWRTPGERSDTVSTAEVSDSAVRAFGWSLYLFNLFGWILATSDRYIVEHFWSAREVGIYALNYGLWSIPYLSLNGWLEAVVRARIFERAESADRAGVSRLLGQRFALVLALGAGLTTIIFLAGRWIALYIIGEKYWHGVTLMMTISVAHLFYVLAAAFHGAFQAIKRAQVLMWIAMVGSIANFTSNLYLVPRFGIEGAAWSTLGAYALMCVITMAAWPITFSHAYVRSSPDHGR